MRSCRAASVKPTMLTNNSVGFKQQPKPTMLTNNSVGFKQQPKY